AMSTRLYGRLLKEYEDVDIEEMLSKLTEEELEQFSVEVDPDDSLVPPNQRCKDQTSKPPTGPLDRKHLLDYLEQQALQEEDWPEAMPYQPGLKRGKIWTPKDPPPQLPRIPSEDLKVELDCDGDEYEAAISAATETELVDLAGMELAGEQHGRMCAAAFLGLHSMLNQDQYHATMQERKQKPGDKFHTVVKSTAPKALPLEPDNATDVDVTLTQVCSNSPTLRHLNWNNIRNISREKFERLWNGLKTNTMLEHLSLANTGLTDSQAMPGLEDALHANSTLRSLNVESNYLTGAAVRDLIKALLPNQSLLEFRATNQASQVLGNKLEMDIAQSIEQNSALLRLGLSFAVADARVRVTKHLQDNNDACNYLSSSLPKPWVVK
ncbi:TMOD1, partial [Cordylochernes scorpioides]